MKCVKCDCETAVTNSRPSQGNETTRRRRTCLACGHRFTTIEVEVVATTFADANSPTLYGAAVHRGRELASLFSGMDREDAALAMRLLRRLAGGEAINQQEAAISAACQSRAAA